ncbi:hypothetical protein, partial [Photorhabdus temperata]|uniref:hypothetical protein n=1 Tax=Photorhabdus temperata TaxID=574560 RepID=UPI001E60F233
NNTFNISVADDSTGFSSPSKFPSRLMSAGVPFGGKDGFHGKLMPASFNAYFLYLAFSKICLRLCSTI